MSVAEYINSNKGYTIYRLDINKMENVSLEDQFGLSKPEEESLNKHFRLTGDDSVAAFAEKISREMTTEQFEMANYFVSNVLTPGDPKRFWFDALAIQHPELCRELPKTKYQKADTIGDVIEMAMDEDGGFGPSAK